MRLVWRGATTNGTLGVGPCEKPPAGTAQLENPGALLSALVVVSLAFSIRVGCPSVSPDAICKQST